MARNMNDLYVIPNNTAGVKLVNELLKLNFSVYWMCKKPDSKFSFLKNGVFIASVQPRALLEQLVSKYPIEVHRLPAHLELVGYHLRIPRISLYNGQGADGINARFKSDAEYSLNLLGFHYVLVNENNIKEGILNFFDALIITPGDAMEMLNGWNPELGWNREPWQLPGSSQGLKEEGMKKIKEFIKGGGTYIGIGCGGGTLACKEVGGLANVNTVKIEYEEKFKMAAGKSRVYLKVADRENPVMFEIDGYTDEEGNEHDVFPAYYFSDPLSHFYGAPIFAPGDNVKILATYHDIDSEPWTNFIANTELFKKDLPAIVEQPLGKGRIILFGVDILYGASWISTYKLLSNSLFYSVAEGPFKIETP